MGNVNGREDEIGSSSALDQEVTAVDNNLTNPIEGVAPPPHNPRSVHSRLLFTPQESEDGDASGSMDPKFAM